MRTKDNFQKPKKPDTREKYRFERKFYVPIMHSKDLVFLLKTHPFQFKEIYYKRRVNNIYFDTPELDFFSKNIIGDARRVKFRIRWYDELTDMVINPVLELKIKRGYVGTKRSFKLKDFSIKDHVLDNIINSVKNSEVDLDIATCFDFFQPTIMNSYMRQYFMSVDEKFRLTVDSELSYYMIDRNKVYWRRRAQTKGCILEMKYSKSDDLLADKVTQPLNLRMTKFSKYVAGIKQFYRI